MLQNPHITSHDCSTRIFSIWDHFWTPTWGPKSEPRTWFLPSESLLSAPGAVLEAPRAQDASRQGSKGDFGRLLEGNITILDMIYYDVFIVKLSFLINIPVLTSFHVLHNFFLSFLTFHACWLLFPIASAYIARHGGGAGPQGNWIYIYIYVYI